MRVAHALAVALTATLALATSGCRTTINAADTPAHRRANPELYEMASTYLRNPTLSHVRISPDGQNIAAIFAREETDLLIVKPTFGKQVRTLAKLERTRRKTSLRVNTVGWAGDDKLVVSVEMPHASARRVRARQTRLMVVPLEGGSPRYIGRKWRHQEYMGSQDQIVSWLHDEPDSILLALWMPDQRGAGARKVNVRSGALSLVARPRYGTTGWAADHAGRVRAGWGESDNDSENFLMARIHEDDRFTEIARWDPSEEQGLFFAGFSAEASTIYVYKDTERGRLGVYEYDLESQQLGGLVWGHPEYDVTDVITSKQDDRLLAIGYVSDRPELHFIDSAERELRESLNAALPGRTNVVTSTDRNGHYAIVRSSSDTDPPTYYVFDRKKRTISKFFDAYPDAEAEARPSEMKGIAYEARDGLRIHGYLTVPNGEGPHPTIVVPHGGPWARDVWGWDGLVQLLVRRGFAVLQPNFRGSTGYGTDFQTRGYGRWGFEMQDDITDGVDWLVAEGIADPERVGIFGGSYGGFAALTALIKEPTKFKAGASVAGVTDILTTLDDDKSYWGLIDDMQRLVGHRWNDRAQLAAMSPARNAEKIQAPVLIAHGTEDQRVHVKQAHAMIDALESLGKPVEALLYQGETHSFLDERNAIDFHAKLVAFFERHLVAPQPDATAARGTEAR